MARDIPPYFCVLNIQGRVILETTSAFQCALLSEPGTCFGHGETPKEAHALACAVWEKWQGRKLDAA